MGHVRGGEAWKQEWSGKVLLTSEQRPKQRNTVNYVANWGNSILYRGNSNCKDPG